jgi:hypothetical protein
MMCAYICTYIHTHICACAGVYARFRIYATHTHIHTHTLTHSLTHTFIHACMRTLAHTDSTYMHTPYWHKYVYGYILSLSHTHTLTHTHTHTYTRRSYVSFSKYRQRIVSLVFPTLRKLKNPETVGLISPGIQIYVVHVCIHYVFTNVRTLSSPLHARARAQTHTHTHTHSHQDAAEKFGKTCGLFVGRALIYEPLIDSPVHPTHVCASAHSSHVGKLSRVSRLRRPRPLSWVVTWTLRGCPFGVTERLWLRRPLSRVPRNHGSTRLSSSL